MANSEYNYIPTYIRRTINNRPKDVVTSKYWNELFNLLITQGDHTAEELGNILNHFSTRLVGVESEIAESAEAIANIREVFRINVSYSGGGVYSADKTFDEIKAAYDAGQLPYVVDGTTSNSDTIYTLDLLLYDESSAQGFADFRRHLISKNAAHTETLRIYSHTLASGSNIELQTERFNVPNGTTYVKVSSAGGVITTVNGETYSDIKTLINAGKPVVVRYNDVLDFYYFETFEFSDSSGTHKRLNFRCDMGDSVYTLTLRDDNTWAFSENSLQPSSITDAGGYFTTDTVEGALQEIGAGLAGAYRKPSSGIPKTDLAEAVQTSLGKADTALQEHQSLAAYRTAAAQDAIDAQKQSIITDLETIRSGAAKGATAVQPESGKGLFSGSYNDLTDKPTIPDISDKQDKLIAGEGITIAADGKTISSSGKVSSVNGKTGAVTLNAEDVGAQRPLIAGSGISIVWREDGDVIQSDASGGGGNGVVSFVDVAGGAPIAQFTLNQTEDCEINVNDLIQTPLLNNYRTAAAQDAIDATKQDKLIAGEGITIAADGKTISSSGGGKVSSVNGKTGIVNIYVEDIQYTNSSQKLDATIAGLKAADIQTASDISELQTADASLDSRITAIETGDTPVTLYIYWESVVSGGRVSLTKDGAAMSVADFISKMQSGAKIIIGENSDTDSESSGFSNYRYKITDSTTASLAFDVASSFNGSNRTIIISGSSSTNGLMAGYQDINHDGLSDYSPLPEGSTPASKAWVEDYINEKVAALQSKSITDTGGHFTTDTVEGALQEIGAELAGVNTLLGSGIQISFTIDGETFSAVSGETWKEWIGGYSRVVSGTSGLTLYCFSDDGIIFADEAGVNALGLNDVWVHGNETIVSGATYAIIPCGG